MEPSTEGEKIAFLNGLKQFLQDRRKVLLPYPKFAGRVLDLHDLYNKVTNLGGYQKVTEKQLWKSFLNDYNFKNVSSTLLFGLKTIYRKFLLEYERVHYFGDDDTSKSRYDVSIRMTQRPTMISEHERRRYGLSSTRLAENKFSTEISDYERLAFSLISCLPNEVDFAINACTLLSGESRHVLRLSRCPQVLEALLLHAGCLSVDYNSLEGVAEEWTEKTGHNLSKFWKDTVIDKDVLNSMLLNTQNIGICHCSKSSTEEKMKTDCLNAVLEEHTKKESTFSSNMTICPKCFCRKLELEAEREPNQRNEQTNKWSSLFQSTRAAGVQDYEGQRVLQIALVLLNLSFEDFNVILLSRSKPLVRFIFLCIHSNYSALRQTGLDILGNISTKMDLLELGIDILECTYKTLQQCVLSPDKCDQIRGLEILGNLCRCSSNKDCLILTIKDEIYLHALHLLTLGDIELLVAALDALYGVSKLGEETCTQIMLISGSIDILVCLITINVRMFDSSQLSKIRIARRVLPNNPIAAEQAVSQQQQHAQGTAISAHPSHLPPAINQVLPPSLPQVPPHSQIPPHFNHQLISPRMAPSQPVPVSVRARHQQPPPVNQYQPVYHPSPGHHPPLPSRRKLLPQQQVIAPNQETLLPPPDKQKLKEMIQQKTKSAADEKKSPRPLAASPSTPQTAKTVKASQPSASLPTYTHTDTQLIPPVFHYIPAPPSDIVLDKSPQSFAQLWVWATYESCGNDEGSTPRVQVFAEYAAAASRYGMCGNKQVLPASEFGRCLQRVFPRTASRLFKDEKGQPLYHITGIQKRQTPLPVPGHHPQASNLQNGVHPNATTSNHRATGSVTAARHHSVSDCKDASPNSTSSVTLAVGTNITSSTETRSSVAPVAPRKSNSLIEINSTNSVQSESCSNSSSSATDNTIPIFEKRAKTIVQTNVAVNGFPQVNTSNDTLDSNRSHKKEPCNIVSKPESKDITAITHSSNENKPVFPTSNANIKLDNTPKAVSLSNSNHCDVSGTDLHKNGEMNCELSVKEEITNTVNVCSASCSPLRATPLKTTPSEDAVICNGELPLLCSDKSSQKLSIKEVSNQAESKKLQINGLLGGARETVLEDDVKADSDQKQQEINGEMHEKKLPMVGVDHIHNSPPHTVVSPQIAPISPDLLQKHYSTQQQGSKPAHPTQRISVPQNSGNSISDHKTISQTVQNQIPITTRMPLTHQSTDLKRGFPPTPHFSVAPPPPKILKSSETPHFPPLLHHVPPPVSHPANNIPSITTPQIRNPAASILSSTASTSQHHPNMSPHHLPSDHGDVPLPQGQRKAPVIDLMAPNASLLVLYRNSGKYCLDDSTDEKEDPITKSVRLTAVLVLINISNFSAEGRSILKRHEPHLAYLSMSGMDCSPMLAKLLSQLDR